MPQYVFIADVSPWRLGNLKEYLYINMMNITGHREHIISFEFNVTVEEVGQLMGGN